MGSALAPIPIWILSRGGRADEFQKAQFLILSFSGLVVFGAGLLSTKSRLTALLIGIPAGIALGVSPIGLSMQIVLGRWLGGCVTF